MDRRFTRIVGRNAPFSAVREVQIATLNNDTEAELRQDVERLKNKVCKESRQTYSGQGDSCSVERSISTLGSQPNPRSSSVPGSTYMNIYGESNICRMLGPIPEPILLEPDLSVISLYD